MRSTLFLLSLIVLLCALLVGCRAPTATKIVPPLKSTTASATTLASSTSTPTHLSAITPSRTLTPVTTRTFLPVFTPSEAPTSLYAVRRTPNSPNEIRSMLMDHQGNLWTGGPGEVNWNGGPGVVVRWNLETGEPTMYTSADGLANAFVVSLTQTGDGSIWAATFGGGLSRFDAISWRTFTKKDGLPSNYISNVVTRSDGSLWINTYRSLPKEEIAFGSFDGQQWTHAVGGGWDTLTSAPDGSFWASSYEFGIGHFVDGVWQDTDFPATKEHVTALGIAADGEVWAATLKSVYKNNGSGWEMVETPWSDQPNPQVTKIVSSPNGKIWFGFSVTDPEHLDKCGYRLANREEVGIYQYDRSSWDHFTTEDGLIDNKICTILAGPDGSIWVGTFDKGVSRFDGISWTSYAINH